MGCGEEGLRPGPRGAAADAGGTHARVIGSVCDAVLIRCWPWNLWHARDHTGSGIAGDALLDLWRCHCAQTARRRLGESS
jgi:hypothetical protein